MIAVVGVLVAVLVVTGAVLWSRSSPDETPPTAGVTNPAVATTAPAGFAPPAGGCPSLGGQSGEVATVRAGTPLPPVALATASYLIDKATRPARVSRAGQLTGSIPAGSHVWLLDYPRPDTFDSTPERNPGSARLYPIGEVETTDGCWVLPPRALGYPEALGITYDQYIVLVDDTVAREFADELVKKRRDGFSLDELALRRTETIATFTIPTTP